MEEPRVEEADSHLRGAAGHDEQSRCPLLLSIPVSFHPSTSPSFRLPLHSCLCLCAWHAYIYIYPIRVSFTLLASLPGSVSLFLPPSTLSPPSPSIPSPSSPLLHPRHSPQQSILTDLKRNPRSARAHWPKRRDEARQQASGPIKIQPSSEHSLVGG